MKVSAQVAMWGAIALAIFCLAYAFSGFWSLDSVADEASRADARGFAYFWLFLGGVGVAIAILSRWMAKQDDGAE